MLRWYTAQKEIYTYTTCLSVRILQFQVELEESEYFYMKENYMMAVYAPEKEVVIPIPLQFADDSTVMYSNPVCKPGICDTVGLFDDDHISHRHRIELCTAPGNML